MGRRCVAYSIRNMSTVKNQKDISSRDLSSMGPVGKKLDKYLQPHPSWTVWQSFGWLADFIAGTTLLRITSGHKSHRRAARERSNNKTMIRWAATYMPRDDEGRVTWLQTSPTMANLQLECANQQLNISLGRDSETYSEEEEGGMYMRGGLADLDFLTAQPVNNQNGVTTRVLEPLVKSQPIEEDMDIDPISDITKQIADILAAHSDEDWGGSMTASESLDQPGSPGNDTNISSHHDTKNTLINDTNNPMDSIEIQQHAAQNLENMLRRMNLAPSL